MLFNMILQMSKARSSVKRCNNYDTKNWIIKPNDKKFTPTKFNEYWLNCVEIKYLEQKLIVNKLNENEYIAVSYRFWDKEVVL